MYLLIYKTLKHDVIYHLNNTIPFNEVGSINSYNWRLISIQSYANGRFNNVVNPFQTIKKKKIPLNIYSLLIKRKNKKIARLRYLLEKEENKWKMK